MPPVADFVYFTARGLASRGWSRALRVEVLGAPDATTNASNDQRALLYLRSRVLEAEQRPEVAGQLLVFWSYQERTAKARVKYYRDQLWKDKRGRNG